MNAILREKFTAEAAEIITSLSDNIVYSVAGE
jgi:hypothetical protein